MSEENKQGDNGDKEPGELKPLKELKLTITKNLENNQLSVQGPGNGQLYDKYICFGLMEDAKDFIKAHNHQVSAQDKIVSPNLSMTEQIRGMFKRR